MARIELSFPEDAFTFHTDMTVRSCDINAAHHLANDRLVAMLSEARFRFWMAAGAVDPQTSRTPLIVTDLATVYRAEARGWDVLRFDVGFADANRYGGDIVFRVTRPADKVVVALAKSGFVCFDYTAGRVVPMPPELADRLARPSTWTPGAAVPADLGG